MHDKKFLQVVELLADRIDGRTGHEGEYHLRALVKGRKPLLVWVHDLEATEGAWCQALASRALLAATAHVEHRSALHQAGYQRIRVWRKGWGELSELLNQEEADGRQQLQIQGPFETSYSLALTNRELATALARLGNFDVSIHATEGPGDYEPEEDLIALYPDAKKLFERRHQQTDPDIVIRQMWPPRVDDSNGNLTYQYFAWEETQLPRHLVDSFNLHLTGIGVVTPYVAEVLRNSGVTVPIKAVGIGIRSPIAHQDANDTNIPQELDNLREICLLHISSALPRKGVDVLLKAYFKAFSGQDSVSLVIKSHPNPHNRVKTLLTELQSQHADPPDVRWINRELDSNEIAHLYDRADVYIHPARAEGFGLPVAEAMAARIPVIATSCSGLAGLVSEATARVIPSLEVPARSHVSEPGSTWFEPDHDELVVAMLELLQGDKTAERKMRVQVAEELVSKKHNWDDVATAWVHFIEEQRLASQKLCVALVTSFNSPCGIAEYSKSLINAMPALVQTQVLADLEGMPINWQEEPEIKRCWWPEGRGNIQSLIESLNHTDADIIHIQTNFGLLGLEDLAKLIDSQQGIRPVVVTLHRTKDREEIKPNLSLSTIQESLARAAAIIVHQQQDVKLLASWGLSTNVVKISHGTDQPWPRSKADRVENENLMERPLILGTFGFLLPHKGLHILLLAQKILLERGLDARVHAYCAAHPSEESKQQMKKCRTLIKTMGLQDKVKLEVEYQDMSNVLKSLSIADILVLPYLETNESCSGTLHSLLPLGKPMITTELDIFAGAAEAGALHLVEEASNAELLADKIAELATDREKQLLLQKRLINYACMTQWSQSAAQHVELYRSAVLGNRIQHGAARTDGDTGQASGLQVE